MAEVEEESFIATSLGFPPFQRSHLPSKTYQAIVQIFSLFDLQSHQTSSQNPLKSGNNLNSTASIHLGQKTQEKEGIRFLKNNTLSHNEVENRVEVEEPTFNSWGNVVSDSASSGNQIGLEQNLLDESVAGQLFHCKISEPIENNGEKTHFPEGNVEEEREKEIDIAGDRVTRDSDIEEGEISGDIGEVNLPNNCILEDHVESREHTLEEKQVPKDNQDLFSDSKEQMGTYEKGMLSIIKRMSTANSKDNLLRSRMKERKGKLDSGKALKVKERDADDRKFDVGPNKNETKKTKESNKVDKLSFPGAVSERVATENGGNTASDEVVEADNRKKRVITEQSKKRKKDKRRKKRAEEDRKSGVKRLKIEPCTKPKTLRDCKYHLYGKCQQGDSCKFSHAMTPVTKYKPCNFYALNKCLKGDECAYDHELGKYPCDKFKSTGSCPRGATCSFSHQVDLVNDYSPVSHVNKIAQEASAGKQPPPPRRGSTFLPKSTTPAEMTPPAQPKGISFLSFGGDDSGKRAASRTPPAFKPCLSQNNNTPSSIQKLRDVAVPTISNILQEFLFNGH